MDPSDTTDEPALIRRILGGERDAFAELVRAHQARILRLCASLLHNPTAAEDAAQEIFFRAYQRLRSFRGQSAFSTWLYRIASNHCMDLLRERTRERTESLDRLIEESGEPAGERAAAPQDPAAALANAELVRRALARLSPEYRLILTLRELEGLSYQELAEALGCSLDAVKARLRRARDELLGHLRHVLGAESVKQTGAR